MPSMPKVPWSVRLGRVGQVRVESMLSYFSNPLQYELDVGVDFYCELLEDDLPSTPFYVQAKGTEHFNVGWGRAIEKSTIVYWLTQSFPVFLVVYDEPNDLCYWMSIEDKRIDLLMKMRKPTKTIYIKMDRSHSLKRGKNMNNDFIRKVKEDTASVALSWGRPQPVGEGYVKRIPDAPRSPLELGRATEGLRMTMYSLVRHYLFQVDDLDNARLCCEFLAKFDRSHFNHFFWLAMVNKRQGNKEAARENCRQALEICERDKKWPRESMENIKVGIKKLMEDP